MDVRSALDTAGRVGQSISVYRHLMSLTIGMMGSVETATIRSDVSVCSVTVSRDGAEFTKKRRSSKTAELHTHPEKGFM